MAWMSRPDVDMGRAWQLLVKFFFAQRDRLPSFGEEFELSTAQCHVLHLVEPETPLPMGRLADALGCDASNVTGLIDQLEARGLARRRPSAEDRRVKTVQLTPAGVRVRRELLRRMTGDPCRLSKLSVSDQQALVRILEAILDTR